MMKRVFFLVLLAAVPTKANNLFLSGVVLPKVEVLGTDQDLRINGTPEFPYKVHVQAKGGDRSPASTVNQGEDFATEIVFESGMAMAGLRDLPKGQYRVEFQAP